MAKTAQRSKRLITRSRRSWSSYGKADAAAKEAQAKVARAFNDCFNGHGIEPDAAAIDETKRLTERAEAIWHEAQELVAVTFAAS